MYTKRIHQVLEQQGLTNLPQDKEANLIQGGLDSLMLALVIIALESEFKVKIPVIPLVKSRFETVASIGKHLLELGAE